MATYSHSKVSAYENCPRQYKFKYIEHEEPDIKETIEMFLGSRVHETLEKLYKDKKFGKKISKTNILKFFRDTWDRQINKNILVVKKDLTQSNYKKMGEKFISNYYDRMQPFDQLIILGLETQDKMTLKDGNRWHVRIDKFACDNKGNYYVCDYKTNAEMKDQEEADQDRQLAMYSIWIKDKFKDAKSIKLVWHMLAFNKDVYSERTELQLQKLEDEVIKAIKIIEQAIKEDNFPTNVTPLCDYCEFKSKCPSFMHKLYLEKKSIRQFKKNEGVKFVDEYSELKGKIKEFNELKEKLEEKLIDFAKQFKVDIVYGSNNMAKVKEIEKVILPEDETEKETFIQLLKGKGLWEEFSMICYPKINSSALKNELDKDLKSKLEIVEDYRISLAKREDLEDY
jgi:putative RecB family exonuclease